jgi:hypothetical protein
MEKNILVEVNRMRELMGKSSLILEGEGDILKYIERIFASEGDDAIKSIVKTVDSEVDNALLVLNRKKSGKKVTKADLENAYKIIKTKIEPNKLVDNLISKNLLDVNFKNAIDTIKDKANKGNLSISQYENLIDKYIDNAMIGVDDMTRNAFKKKFKSEIPTGMKSVEELSKTSLDKMKSEFPEIFETKLGGMFLKNPDKVKRLEDQIIAGWKNSGLNKEQILDQVKKEGDEMITALKKSKLTSEDKSKITTWWNKFSVSKQWKDASKVGSLVLLVYVVILFISNSSKYGNPIGGAAATAVEVGSEFIKGAAKSTVNQLQGDTTQTTKPSEPIKSDTTKPSEPIKSDTTKPSEPIKSDTTKTTRPTLEL